MNRTIVFALFGAFVAYALVAFIAWDWNASNWSTEGRAVAAFAGFFAGVQMAVYR